MISSPTSTQTFLIWCWRRTKLSRDFLGSRHCCPVLQNRQRYDSGLHLTKSEDKRISHLVESNTVTETTSFPIPALLKCAIQVNQAFNLPFAVFISFRLCCETISHSELCSSSGLREGQLCIVNVMVPLLNS